MSLRPHILVMAAGKGTRMVSSLPKVLHPVLFRPLLHHVLDLATALPHSSISIIVGHGEKEVRDACAGYSDVRYFLQSEQLGTGHAVKMAEPFLSKQSGQCLVLSGDVCLVRMETLLGMIASHESSKASLTLLSARPKEPKGYGRILRNDRGSVVGIREEKDGSPTELAVGEVNAGVYLFDLPSLLSALSRLENRNAQKEYYLTDTVALLASAQNRVEAFCLEDAAEMQGINDRCELASVEAQLQGRINQHWMKAGVSLHRPESSVIDSRSRFGKDVSVEPDCTIINSSVADGCVIERGSRLVNTTVGAGTTIKQGSYLSDSTVGEGCSVGPYAHLRPHSSLSDRVKIGNFVEIKKSNFGVGSKASHLSYIGDAEIGQDVNLGCGFITCNYDGGPIKHKTTIEDGVFVGSDSQTVAPVTLGKDSYVASGTTVTKDVPADSLAISRGKQINKVGYASKFRKG